MSLAGFWFDSGLNTTQYGGPPDEKILDLGPTVWAQWPFLSPGPEFKPKRAHAHLDPRRLKMRFLLIFRVKNSEIQTSFLLEIRLFSGPMDGPNNIFGQL